MPVDLCTLADLKHWLGVTGTDDDNALTRMIWMASQAMRDMAGSEIVSTTYAEVRNGQNRPSMATRRIPVTAVSSVKVDGRVIPAATSVTGSGFRFDEHFIHLNGYLFCKGSANVELVYTAGHATVPQPIAQMCIDVIQSTWGDKGRDAAVGSYSVPGVYSESLRQIASVRVPPAVRQQLLRPPYAPNGIM